MTAFLLICAALLLVAPASAAERATAAERVDAIAPLVAAKLAGTNLQEITAARAKEVGIPERRLELWLNLFLNHGRAGLVSLGKASAAEMAKDVEGTWKEKYRVVEGVQQFINGYQFHRIIDLTESSAKLQSLTLERGDLYPSLCEKETDGDCSFALGNYGVTTFIDVRGEEYGLLPEETAVLMTFKGRFKSEGYPGFGKEVYGVIEALWVKEGEVYRTAFFQHEFRGVEEDVMKTGAGGDSGLPRYRNDANITVIEDTQVVEYAELDAEELSNQVSPNPLVWDIPAYWEMAQSDSRLLLPEVALAATSRAALGVALAKVPPIGGSRVAQVGGN